MTEPPSLDEAPSPPRDHPPFKMRDRRLLVLPDLRPPSLDEIRWSARERRRRREGTAPEQRRPLSHEQLEAREPADVPPTLVEELSADEQLSQGPEPDQVQDLEPVEIVLPEAVLPEPESLPEPEPEPESLPEPEPEPEVATLEVQPEPHEPEVDPDFFDLYDPEFPDLTPWRPAVLPDPEPVAVTATQPAPWVEPAPIIEPEPEIDEGLDEAAAPPLVSQVLVVREPAPPEPGRIAVLDEVEADPATVTRLVPLPAAPAADLAVDAPPDDEIYPEEYEVYADLEPEVEETVELAGRAAPLYWRLLRLRYTRPNGWLRALYFEGAVALGVVLVLADVASVWTIVVLPLVVAVVVKANDVLAGNLRAAYRQPRRGR